jgi:DNA-binding transcriptional LysR family regulator
VRIGALRDAALVARRVGAIGCVLAASPAYLARRGTPAAPEDLAGHETVLFSPSGAAPEWRFAACTVTIAPRFAVNAAEAAVAAAVAGRGITLALSYQVAEELADGRLVRLLPEHEAPPSPVHLVLPSARLLAPRTRAFLDFAAPRLSALEVLR